MRVTILTYVPSESAENVDIVVEQVAEALRENRHTVSVLAVHADVDKLIKGLERQRPDLVFNLLEEFGTNVGGNIPVCGLLDLLGYRYTGCGPGDFYLGQDKALAKKLLAFESIAFPRFAVFSRDKGFETGGNLHLPLFVKPVALDASIGIEKRSLVRDSTSLMQRVLEIHEQCHDDALAEEFIEGREFYVGVLGNQEPTAFSPIEADFSGLPEGAPKVFDRNAKWEPGSAEYGGVQTRIADLPSELRAKLQKVSLEAYRALRVRDYGRVDLRVTEAGDIYVLEVNASCYLERSDEFATAARADGIEFPALIQRIADLAMQRHGRS